MKILFIALNYIRRHIIKFLLITFALALMISSVIFTQIFSYSEEYRRFYSVRQNVMPFDTIFCDVNNEQLTDEILKEYSAGRQYVNGYTVKSGVRQYIGYLDEVALASLNVKILRGRLPENENELAMSDTMLLSYGVSVGDKLTITITDKSGTHEKEFLVSGMTSDFFTEYTKTEVFIPQMSSQENFDTNLITIPSIISGKSDNFLSVNMIQNIIESFYHSKERPFSMGQKVTIINSDNDIAKGNQVYEVTTDDIIFVNVTIQYVIPAFLVIIMISGVYTAVKMLAEGQKSNIQLIKITGGTKSQIFLLFFYEALFISLLSSIISFFTGTGICYAFSAMINELGVSYKMPFQLVFLISAIAFFALLIFYIMYFFIIIKEERNKKQKSKRKYKSLYSLWIKTVDRNNSSSKVAFRIVIAASVIIFSAGCYFGDFISMIYVHRIESAKQFTYDYLVRVPSGTTLSEAMYYNLPSGCGLTNEEIIEITEKCPVKTVLKAMDYNINAYLDLRKFDDSKKKNVVSIPKNMKEAFLNSGIEEPSVLYKYNVNGIPYEHLSEFIGDVGFSKEDYDSGKVVMSINGKFSENDEMKLSFLMFPYEINHLTSETTELIPEVYTIDLKITDCISVSNTAKKAREITDLISEKGSCIVMSDIYLLSVCDKFRYDYVVYDNAYIPDEATAFETDEYIAAVADNNDLHLYNNFIAPMLVKKEADKQRTPYIALSIIYLMIVAFFSYICINCEVRNKIKNYLILKSVGTDKQTLTKLVMMSSIKKMLPGIIVGSALYFAGYGIFSYIVVSEGYQEYFPFIQSALYPVIIISAILIIGIATSIISANWIYKQEKAT